MAMPALAQLGLYFLVLGRSGGLFAAAPVLSSNAVPMPVRAALSALLALGVTPAVAVPPGGVPQALLPYAGLLVREVAVGLLLGLLAQAVFAAIELAGTYCDIELGLTIAAVVDPVNGESTSLFAEWFSVLGTLIFVAGGGLEVLVAVLALSYRHLPLGAPVVLSGGVAVALGALGWAMLGGFGIAAPLLALAFLLNVLLGVISRAMPQLNALQSVMPAQILVALVVLLLALPALLVGFGNLIPEVLTWSGRLWA